LVDALIGANLICASVRGERAEGLSSTAGVVAAVVLYDVILGLRRVDPAVDGEV
jgi:hypothetical protein